MGLFEHDQSLLSSCNRGSLEHVSVRAFLPWEGKSDPHLGKTLEEAEIKSEVELIKQWCRTPDFAKVNLYSSLVGDGYMW